MRSNRVQRRGEKVKRIESIMQFRKKERKKERQKKKLFRVLNNYLGFKMRPFFLSLFFLSFVPFRHFALPHFFERVLAQLTEKDREAQSNSSVSREKERDLFAPFLLFAEERALFYL